VDGAARALRAMGSKGSVPVSGEALAPLDSSD